MDRRSFLQTSSLAVAVSVVAPTSLTRHTLDPALKPPLIEDKVTDIHLVSHIDVGKVKYSPKMIEYLTGQRS